MPTEEVVEVRRGKKVNAERKFFPGYVLVKMALNDETWSLVRNTAKVTGFLGQGGKPSPIPDTRPSGSATRCRRAIEHPKPSIAFMSATRSGSPTGPFASFNGVVEEVDEARAGSRCRSRSSAGPPRSSWSTRRSRSSSRSPVSVERQRGSGPPRRASDR